MRALVRGGGALLLVACARAPVRESAGAPDDTARAGACAGADPRAIDLSGSFNHDLLGGATAPTLALSAPVPMVAPVPLRVAPAGGPDALLLRSGAAPQAPAEAHVPLGCAATTLYLLVAAVGPLDARELAAEGELVYADGRTQGLKWLVGEHAWPAQAGATGRFAEAVALGRGPQGETLTASLLTVDVAYPDVPVRTIVLRPRSSALSFALLAVTAAGQGPVTPQGAPDRADMDLAATYPFEVRRLPGAVPRHVKRKEDVPRIRAEGGRLVRGEAPWRGWGVNLVGKGALPPAGEAEAWAERVVAMGFDLVRLHHLDGEGVGLLDPARGDLRPDGSRVPTFLPDGLDRLDRFVAALESRGVDLVLEGWTLRSFRPVEGLPEPGGLPMGHKLAPYWSPAWEQARQEHVAALWGRVNPYTGRHYRDDPHVAVVELANEDSLLTQWASGGLERISGGHRRALDVRWNAWLRARYGEDARLAAAWSRGTRAGLQPGESLALDSVAREPAARTRTEVWPHARGADLATFYAELERGHHARMAAHAREVLGFAAPLVCDTSFGVPLAESTVDACDAVDLHLYWDPPSEQQVYSDTSLLRAPMQARFLEKLAWCQEGTACTVSELDHTFPSRWMHEMPLAWAAIGARQGWDMLAFFAWSHAPIREGGAPEGSHDLQGRANVLAQLPAARELFRTLPAAERTFTRWWSPPALLRDLAEGPGLWLDPHAAPWGALQTRLRTRFSEAPPSLAAQAPWTPGQDGPVRWDVAEGRMTVATQRVRAVIGPGDGALPAAPGRPSALRVAVTAPGGSRSDREGGPIGVAEFAPSAVSLVALDAASLEQGGRALLTVAGRAEREGTLHGTGPSLRAWGRGPVRMQRLGGTVSFAWPRRPVVVALDGDALPTGRVPVRRARGGGWEVRLDGLATPWLEVR